MDDITKAVGRYLSTQDQAAMMPETYANPFVQHMLGSILSVPQRAFQSSESMRLGGGYDPAPIVDAAMMAMGGTGFGAPVGAIGAGPTRRFGPKSASGRSVDEMMAERQTILQNADAVRQAEIAADIQAGRIRPGSTETFAEKQAAMRAAREADDLAMEDAASMLAAGPLRAPRRLQSSVMDAYAKRGTTVQEDIAGDAVDQMRALLRQGEATPVIQSKPLSDQETLDQLRRLLQQSGDF